MNKERVTYTDEEFEGLEEKELHAYINNPPKVNKKKATKLGAGQIVRKRPSTLTPSGSKSLTHELAFLVKSCAKLRTG